MITSKLVAGVLNAKKLTNRVILPEFVYKPTNILGRFREYRHRCSCVRNIKANECYDVARLKQDGYLRLQPSRDEVEELVRACSKRLSEKLNAGGELGVTHKDWASLVSKEDLHPDSIFLKFAVNETILNTVAKYLGSAPYLENVKLLYSVPIRENFLYSQQWHRDYEDVSQIKVFVCIQDVSEENGPFTFFPRQASRRIPRYTRYIGHAPDEYIKRFVPLSDAIAFTGTAGSTLMIDTTNCVHMGSRCTKPRLMYTANYTSGFLKQSPNRPVIMENEKGKFVGIQRLALGF